MEHIKNRIDEKIKIKKEELERRQEYFSTYWENEKDSECFEKNAIADLLVMKQLKDEIRELEDLALYCEALCWSK